MNKRVLAIILLLMVLSISYAYGTNNMSNRIEVEYLKTSDGDTMRAKLDGENVRIRFLGINTPEVSGEDKVEEPWGNEALAFTKEMLDKANKIEIEYDDVADHEDRFGRKLAWIWVDDELFEIKLLEQGLAKTYMLKNDYKYANELKEAERKAKSAKIGVWSENAPVSDDKESPTDTNMDRLDEQKNTGEMYDDDSSSDGFLISLILAIIIVLIIVIYSKSKGRFNNKKQ